MDLWMIIFIIGYLITLVALGKAIKDKHSHSDWENETQIKFLEEREKNGKL